MPQASGLSSERVNALGEMLVDNTRYIERLTEHLAFLPSGGLSWQRDIQLMIPESASPDGPNIVSLGIFDRRRFTDFRVVDPSGRRLNLLTRYQHGIALTHAALLQYFDRSELAAIKEAYIATNRTPGHRLIIAAHKTVVHEVYRLATNAGVRQDAQEKIDAAKPLGFALASLFRALYEDPRLGDPERRLGELKELSVLVGSQFYDLQRVTQYLCWADAKAGEVINLHIQYSMTDPHRVPAGTRPRLRVSPVSRAAGDRPSRMTRKLTRYRRFGLAPLEYKLDTRVSGTAGSYYFSVDPPSDTEVTYMDWALGNAFTSQDDEWDCAHPTIHVNNADSHRRAMRVGPADAEKSGSTIRIYLRAAPYAHKRLAVGGALNLIFVYFVATGRFSPKDSGSVQAWLVLTPTLLIAYIAEQQRHYYANATRRLRAGLWVYLGMSLLFLVAVAFSAASPANSGVQGWGWVARGAALAEALASVLMIVWFLPTGLRAHLVTKEECEREFAVREKLLERGKPARSTHRIYDRAILRYCDRVVLLAVFAMVVVLLGTWLRFGDEIRSRPVFGDLVVQKKALVTTRRR